MKNPYKAAEKTLRNAFNDFFVVSKCKVMPTGIGWLLFVVIYHNNGEVCRSETLHAPEELERYPEKLFAELVIEALERAYK